MPNSDQAVFHCPGRAAASPGSKPVCGEPDWDHDEHSYPVPSLKPTHGQPHDSESLDGCEGIGWDLSWGFRLNVGHDTAEDPTSPLTIGASFSDTDQARGIVVRETTPDQLEAFARLLLAIAAKHRARTAQPVAYVDRCPDNAPHLWVGRDGRPATGDDTDRCDACGAQRSTDADTATNPITGEPGNAPLARFVPDSEDPMSCDGGTPGGFFPTACGRDAVHPAHPLGRPPSNTAPNPEGGVS